jgi:hypothetical protein
MSKNTMILAWLLASQEVDYAAWSELVYGEVGKEGAENQRSVISISRFRSDDAVRASSWE